MGGGGGGGTLLSHCLSPLRGINGTVELLGVPTKLLGYTLGGLGFRSSSTTVVVHHTFEPLPFLFIWQHIFMWEQEEYKKEGIDWTGITFADNKPVLVSLKFSVQLCFMHVVHISITVDLEPDYGAGISYTPVWSDLKVW